MRFDSNKDTSALALEPRQQLFAQTWFNAVHEFSLDAFRVRVMNPINILDESLKSLSDSSAFDGNDRTRIWKELLTIFEDSALLNDKAFHPAKREFMHLLEEAVEKPKESAKLHPMIEAFGRELYQNLNKRYVPICTKWLLDTLSQTYQGAGEDPELPEIEKVTSQLLSCLVADGWSIESLYKMYRTTLTVDPVHTPAGDTYSFATAAKWMFGRLERQNKNYKVTFSINRISNGDAIPQTVGDIQFCASPQEVPEDSPESVKKFLRPAPNKLFATMTVPANDGRIAGMTAAIHIEQVLDVVRYDFLKQNFALSDSFMVEKEDGNRTLLDIVKTVPNPQRIVTAQELQDFMTRLSNLVSSDHLREASKDRIYSAFRLYRTGAETSNLENKLVNWWTALEYLVKFGGNGNIGEAVENALYPTVVLSYVPKHLDTTRIILRHFDIELKDAAGHVISQTNLTDEQLYLLLATPTVRTSIETGVAGSPFATLYFKKFFRKYATPSDLHRALQNHEQAVKWQVQRIYRARCDIVHSAGRVDQAALLCANLESYLKTLLDAFLQSLHNLQTLRAPKEFFDRQRHTYDRIMTALAQRDSAYLTEHLASR